MNFSRATISLLRPTRLAISSNSTTSLLRSRRYSEKAAGESEELEKTTESVESNEENEELEEQNTQIAELQALAKSLNDKWKAAMAETENMRKIAQRDVAKARDFGAEKMVKSLFPVLDTLAICIKNKPDFEAPEHKNNAEAQNAFQGLEATHKLLSNIFSDNGMEEIRPELGDEFDPNVHNALFQMAAPSEVVKPGQIGLVVKTGWKRKDFLMRPADVGVVRPEE